MASAVGTTFSVSPRADGLLYTSDKDASTGPDLSGTPIGIAAASIGLGESIDLTPTIPLSGLSSAGLAWQASWDWDETRARAVLYAKGANNDVAWNSSFYDALTNTWTPIWTGGEISASGHIYGNNAMDPATGDSFIYLFNTQRMYKIDAASDYSTWSLHTNTVNFIGQIVEGADWHPNLFGQTAGGLVARSPTRGMVAWDPRDDSWTNIGSTYEAGGGTGYGQLKYLASEDSLFSYSSAGNPSFEINGGVSSEIVTAPQINVRAGSALNSACTQLIPHPSDSGRLLLLEQPTNNPGPRVWQSTDGVNWSLTGWTHPFPAATGVPQEGYSVCSIPALGCVWGIDAVTSILWRPDS